jgi:hypothetical protein
MTDQEVQLFLVLIEVPETAAPLVDIGAALAASREHSQLILCHLVAQEHDTRLEVATGPGGELPQRAASPAIASSRCSARLATACLPCPCPNGCQTTVSSSR